MSLLLQGHMWYLVCHFLLRHLNLAFIACNFNLTNRNVRSNSEALCLLKGRFFFCVCVFVLGLLYCGSVSGIQSNVDWKYNYMLQKTFFVNKTMYMTAYTLYICERFFYLPVGYSTRDKTCGSLEGCLSSKLFHSDLAPKGLCPSHRAKCIQVVL